MARMGLWLWKPGLWKILEFFNWIIKGSVLWMFYWFDPSPASWQPHIACALTINNMHSKLKDTRRILGNAESTNRIWNIATTSYPCVRTTGPRVFMHFTENRWIQASVAGNIKTFLFEISNMASKWSSYKNRVFKYILQYTIYKN